MPIPRLLLYLNTLNLFTVQDELGAGAAVGVSRSVKNRKFQTAVQLLDLRDKHSVFKLLLKVCSDTLSRTILLESL